MPNNIQHYGVPGMKWGQRKQRGTSSKSSKPKAKSMTDDDLRKAVARMKLERQYSDMVASTTTKSTKERMLASGAKHAGSTVGKSAQIVVGALLVKGMNNAANNAIAAYQAAAFGAKAAGTIAEVF